eukprot:TRINITY_DN747_c0_g1_i3.p2 TRINITY_DN747_c0_g1~~TRINITY_DN747_c0_g1_i3.p2  ORF type:complete len:267 (-),score=39.66 TRINITY_DN747_c0_g1_i3:792-1592(-)
MGSTTASRKGPPATLRTSASVPRAPSSSRIPKRPVPGVLRARRCVCLSSKRFWVSNGDKSKKGHCACSNGLSCGKLCCDDVCYAKTGAGPNATECKKPFKCEKGHAPCGHTSRDGMPSMSTTCCKTSEVCVADANHVTSCAAQKSCPKGRQPCGGTAANFAIIGGDVSFYFEYTAHDKCCPRGTRCGYSESGKSSCKKPITCGKGETACGRFWRKVYFLDMKPSYYPTYVESHPNNVCCPNATKDCIDPASGSAPVSETICIKKEA